jgi:hypothetical protein
MSSVVRRVRAIEWLAGECCLYGDHHPICRVGDEGGSNPTLTGLGSREGGGAVRAADCERLVAGMSAIHHPMDAHHSLGWRRYAVSREIETLPGALQELGDARA